MLDIARRSCGGEILRGPMGKEGTPGPIKKINPVQRPFSGLTVPRTFILKRACWNKTATTDF